MIILDTGNEGAARREEGLRKGESEMESYFSRGGE